MHGLTNETQPTVLIIDDEKTVRDSFRSFLEDNDYKVLEAENGPIGLEKFKETNPDVVLLDLRMPEMNGLEVLSRLAKISSDTPTIVISGAGEIEEAVKAIRLGAHDYLVKPIKEMSMLLHSIEKALDHSRLIEQNRLYQEYLEKEVEKRTKDLELANIKLRKANQRIQEQQKEAIEKERLKVLLQLAGTTAHELAQPLTVLLGCIEMVLMDNDLPKDLAQLIDRINDAGQRIANVVKKIQSIRHYEIKPYAEKLSIIDIEQKVNLVQKEDSEDLSQLNKNRYLTELVEWEVSKARRYDTKLALCLIGPDNIEQVIDNYGHSAGSMFLSKILKILKNCIRESDLCTRYGDEGLAVIMPNTETEAGQIVCERIRDTLSRNHFEYNSSQFETSATLGFTTIMDSRPDNPLALMDMAGEALCAAREKTGKTGARVQAGSDRTD